MAERGLRTRTEVASVSPPATRKIWYPVKSASGVAPFPSFQPMEIVAAWIVAPGAGAVIETSAAARDATAVRRVRNRMIMAVKGRCEVDESGG